MNKAPRFIQEYINYKITKLCSVLKDQPDFPLRSKIIAMKRYKDLYQRGLITLDEAMQGIAEV